MGAEGAAESLRMSTCLIPSTWPPQPPHQDNEGRINGEIMRDYWAVEDQHGRRFGSIAAATAPIPLPAICPGSCMALF
jgi:hypothetical protein